MQPSTGIKVPLVTPAQFIEEYAERIVQLVEDAKLRIELGEQARECVVRFHDWPAVESSWLTVYDDVLTNSSLADLSTPCH